MRCDISLTARSPRLVNLRGLVEGPAEAHGVISVGRGDKKMEVYRSSLWRRTGDAGEDCREHWQTTSKVRLFFVH